jgi:hypothetical protein
MANFSSHLTQRVEGITLDSSSFHEEKKQLHATLQYVNNAISERQKLYEMTNVDVMAGVKKTGEFSSAR